MKGTSVCIVGATGAVGQELLDLLRERQWSVSRLGLFASPRSAGKVQQWNGTEHTIESVSPGCFAGYDIAFFSAGTEQSKEFAPQATQAGCLVVDNSSAFRMADDVPLVIPEINMDSVQSHHQLIAVPNCSTIVMLMAIAPLRALGTIERVIVSTYQSVSGAGAAAMEELQTQTRAYLSGEEYKASVLRHPAAFNLFSHDSAIGDDGYNGEESKMVKETQKILDDPSIRVNPTCIRVPVLRAHSESITVEFAGKAPSVEEARAAIAAFPGVRVVDDRASNHFPMPMEASGNDDVLVGRIRQDVSSPNALSLFASGDQIRKGAALNAIQIAEAVLAQRSTGAPV